MSPQQLKLPLRGEETPEQPSPKPSGRLETGVQELPKPKDKISFHGDLDGFVSAVLYMKANPEQNLEPHVCKQFGECREDIKVMVDQRPSDAKWKGLCIDHHDDHPPEGERSYDLVWRKVPATLLVYEKYKDKIPKEEIWKVALGMSGDGQEELTPIEVWLAFPYLLNTSGYPRESYGQVKVFPVALFKICGSLINFASRMGSPMEAFSLLNDAVTPWDIITNKYLRGAREKVTKEMRNVLATQTFPIDLGRKVYWEYTSDSHLWVAHNASDSSGKTAVTLNKTNGRVSIRGPIAKYIANELKKRGIEAGGHPKFCGANLTEDQYDLLLPYLMEMEL